MDTSVTLEMHRTTFVVTLFHIHEFNNKQNSYFWNPRPYKQEQAPIFYFFFFTDFPNNLRNPPFA